MGPYSEEFLESVEVRLISLINLEYVPLKEPGKTIWGSVLSPGVPSFSVSSSKQIFTVLAGVRGNVFFLMKMENLPFLEAVMSWPTDLVSMPRSPGARKKRAQGKDSMN